MSRLSESESVIHQRFVEYGRNAREWTRRCSLLLPEIERCGIWRKKGFGSLFEYAAKLAGMSRWQVRDALRVLKKLEDKPALRQVVEEKGVGAVRPVVTVATPENATFWAEKARGMTKNTLEVFVKDFREKSMGLKGTSGPRPTFQPVNFPRDLARRLEQFKKRADFVELLNKFLDSLDEKKPEPVRTGSRYIPAHLRHYVLEKTGGICAFPACLRPFEILHHTQRFALEKVHDPDRIQPLCKAHERLAHLGLIENEELPPEKWRLRMQPDKSSPEFWIDEHVALFRGG